MTKKDYVLLAQVIACIKDEKERRKQAQAVGDVCAADNPRFDWVRWNNVCNV